jgi:hypothetical protein
MEKRLVLAVSGIGLASAAGALGPIVGVIE